MTETTKDTSNRDTAIGCMMWLALLAAAIFAGWWWLFQEDHPKPDSEPAQLIQQEIIEAVMIPCLAPHALAGWSADEIRALKDGKIGREVVAAATTQATGKPHDERLQVYEIALMLCRVSMPDPRRGI